MQALAPSGPASQIAQTQGVRESADYAMQMARRIADKLRVIDFRSYEPLSADAAVSMMVRGGAQQVQQSMTDAMRLLASLPVLVLGDAEVPPEEPEESDEAWADFGEPAIDGVPAPQHDRTAEEIDLALARLTADEPLVEAGDNALAVSVWKMLGAQLRQGRARLKHARAVRSKWAMIAEGEEGRRKTLKALQYGMTLALRIAGGPVGGLAFPEDPAELEVALEVRAALIGLRRDLLAAIGALEALRDCELSLALRDIRMRLLDLFQSPVYKALRAGDRFALQALKSRVDGWMSTNWEDVDAARHLLSDVRAFANLLSEVNNRELLVKYDRHVRQQSLDALEDLSAILELSRREGWWHYVRILREASVLDLRSDAFGRFAASELRAPPRFGERLAECIAAARQLLGEMTV